MTIFVTGATGTVGGHIVKQLLSKNVEVKAMSRNPENTSLPPEVHIAVGDLNHPDTLQLHLQNVDSLFLITQSEQTDARFLANQRIIQMAKEAKVRKIVALMDYEGNPIESIIWRRFEGLNKGEWIMGYLFLVISNIGELIGTSMLKASQGFTKLYPSLFTIAAFIVSFFFISFALKILPLNMTYAIWSGVGAVATAIISVLIWKEINNK